MVFFSTLPKRQEQWNFRFYLTLRESCFYYSPNHYVGFTLYTHLLHIYVIAFFLKENILLYRILANHTSCVEDKQRFLLDSLKQMQRAVTEQEHVVLNSLSLLPSHEEVNIIHQCLSAKHQKDLERCLIPWSTFLTFPSRQLLSISRMTHDSFGEWNCFENLCCVYKISPYKVRLSVSV